ncbi:MAG: hypothetical protein R2719_12865 [Micropruina sp.]
MLGARTAKDLQKLRIHTVGDLAPPGRGATSGTELTDLATLTEGEHVAAWPGWCLHPGPRRRAGRPSRLR